MYFRLLKYINSKSPAFTSAFFYLLHYNASQNIPSSITKFKKKFLIDVTFCKNYKRKILNRKHKTMNKLICTRCFGSINYTKFYPANPSTYFTVWKMKMGNILGNKTTHREKTRLKIGIIFACELSFRQLSSKHSNAFFKLLMSSCNILNDVYKGICS